MTLSISMDVILDALHQASTSIQEKTASIACDLPYASIILKLYGPYILCALVAYNLSSRSGLRTWIGLQQASSIGLPCPCRHVTATPSRKIKALAYLLIFAFIAAFAGLAYLAARTSIGGSFLVYLIFLSSTKKFIGAAFNLLPCSVHRTIDGGYMIRHLNDRVKHKHLLSAVAVAISVGAIVCKRMDVFSWIVYAGMANLLSEGHSLSTVRFTYWVTLYGILAIAVTQLNIQHPEARKTLMRALTTEKFTESAFSWYYWTWIVPALYSSLPGVLLSILIRFDYQRHLEAHPEAMDSVKMEVVLPNLPEGQELTREYGQLIGAGATIPSKVPLKFPKPYYRVALFGWLLSQFGVLLSYLAWKVPTDHAFPAVNVVMQMVPAGVESILFFVLVMAFFKGDLKKLAVYKEAWKVQPTRHCGQTAHKELKDSKEAFVEDEKVAIA